MGVNGWLLMSVGDDRQHGGNDGYDDRPDVHYSWDDTVPNHAGPAAGDPIVLWDKRQSLGMSVIEEIQTGFADKILRRCPSCGLAGIKARKGLQPRYKCYKCKAEFEEPVAHVERVQTYRSRHDAGWQDLLGVLPGDHLRALAVAPTSQLSLRPLRWDDFERALAGSGSLRLLLNVSRRLEGAITGGHTRATVRVRIGQGAFRKHLLARQGAVCAFTGEAPASVLDACHLYSYAELGVHHDDGGVLLRRDVHRLFDDGQLAVDPQRLTIDVRDELRSFPQYAPMHGGQLHTEVTAGQIDWLSRHWHQHRE
ncbi:MAG: HNH endonuclease signature motif containing protein [Acidimicrobiales bacterium]|nr:HNH endonuclease signature motif containing protein [Acidimicrobiales bacterium]